MRPPPSVLIRLRLLPQSHSRGAPGPGSGCTAAPQLWPRPPSLSFCCEVTALCPCQAPLRSAVSGAWPRLPCWRSLLRASLCSRTQSLGENSPVLAHGPGRRRRPQSGGRAQPDPQQRTGLRAPSAACARPDRCPGQSQVQGSVSYWGLSVPVTGRAWQSGESPF